MEAKDGLILLNRWLLPSPALDLGLGIHGQARGLTWLHVDSSVDTEKQ